MNITVSDRIILREIEIVDSVDIRNRCIIRSSIVLVFIFLVCSCTSISTKIPTDNKNIQSELELPKYNLEDFDLKCFTPFPDFNRYSFLIDSIIPNEYFAYWECVYKDEMPDDFNMLYLNRGRRVIYNGDSLNFNDFAASVNSDQGFFSECAPMYNCFYYIVGVKPDRKIVLINSEDLLKHFIGKINNDEEAGLVARINGYYIDNESIECGSFRKRQNDYLLYVLEIEDDSLYIERSVRAILTKDGKFKIVDKKVIKTEKSHGIDLKNAL